MQDEPVIRGSKLVLNYTNGSPCDSTESPTSIVNDDDFSQRKIIGGGDDNDHDGDGDKDGDGEDDGGKDNGDGGDGNNDDDDDDNDDKKHEKGNPGCTQRKQTIISLLCDKEPLMSAKASVSFVGQTGHCTYIFEARSSAACGGIETEKQSLGPAGVFGVM